MDELVLTDEQVRVLGALIEKEMATPDYYPLTLNALVNACNQKSNRDPVVQYGDGAVLKAIQGLQSHNLGFEVNAVDSRVPKYEHNIGKRLMLSVQEIAILAVLLLRGPQTVGELRGRTGRLYPFENLEEVAVTLDSLANREQGALVTSLPIQPGRKEPRFAHLLAGEPRVEETPTYSSGPATPPVPVASSAAPVDDELREQVALLEEEVSRLSGELSELKAAFQAFREQFE
ncbi:YceH family protein [Acanthopleuribacter pedis]|uniref:YceH family protein n=1 Tax=Acanthopleuribacter pedis TaxID=442870 RepID=A0A8J7QL07_9BACT|nr:YceH family protein [Acanthopleuribacter pedis]MBO1319915.1 YceH family protein [Acanthopleuribacter pedis]